MSTNAGTVSTSRLMNTIHTPGDCPVMMSTKNTPLLRLSHHLPHMLMTTIDSTINRQRERNQSNARLKQHVATGVYQSASESREWREQSRRVGTASSVNCGVKSRKSQSAPDSSVNRCRVAAIATRVCFAPPSPMRMTRRSCEL